MAMNAMTADRLARILAYLQRLQAARFTGRVEFNFNHGGITRVRAITFENANLSSEPPTEKDEQ